MNQPLVSVNVLMYNSSRYILETLESIKAQTYENIELIISDDKSTDNTVKICEDWLAENKQRFTSCKVLRPEHNTGQSGNYNRAFRAAKGEWIKEIDGDDLLLPNCITDLVHYVTENKDAKYVFGRMTGFGENKKNIQNVLSHFDYSFFALKPEEQLHRLIYKGNCLPSPTSFYNRQYIIDIGFENDERIPYMEDWPKWVNLIKKGVVFHYLDVDVASYRIDSGVSTQFPSENYFRTNALMRAYYIYPEFYRMEGDKGALLIADAEMTQYRMARYYKEQLDGICNSLAYKIGHAIVAPYRYLKQLFS